MKSVMETDYEKWKAGKKIVKVPWVIKHYESVTDFNQYKFGKVVQTRRLLILSIVCFIFGFWFGFLVFG